jgi:hypothetical protein
MTDRKGSPPKGDESDSTVMLKVDDVVPKETAPEPGMGDATLLGFQLPPEDAFTAPATPAAPPQGAGALGDKLRRSPPVAAKLEPATGPMEPTTLDDDAPAGGGDPTLPPVNRRAPSGPTPAPRRATGMRQALPDPAPAAPAPRRATGMRQALPDPAPADPALSGETLMLNPDALLAAAPKTDSFSAQPGPGPEGANATVLFQSLPPEPAPEEQANATVMFKTLPAEEPASTQPSTRAAGKWSRKQAAENPKPAKPVDLADLVEGNDESTAVGKDKPVDATNLGASTRTANGMQLVVSGLLLLVGFAVGVGFFFNRMRKPSQAELELLYPFGDQGMNLPNGRTAPGVHDVTFDYVSADDCDGARCLTYRARNETGSFNYFLIIRQTDGSWAMVTSRPADK